MNTRSHDLEQLRSEYRTASSDDRRRIAETAFKISKEGRKIHSMREALLKAHRSGNIANIKDIHEYVQNKKGYKNE